jgi:hypothetical protein
VGGCYPTIHYESETEPRSRVGFGEGVRGNNGASSECGYSAIARGSGKGRSILAAEPVSVVPKV